MSELSVTFLGGLGRIGRNCMVLEYDGQLLIIDCGVMFPEIDMLGIDFILPDLHYLYERKDDIVGIVITHGHEDHAGGLQFLLSEVSAPIYSSALSLKLLSRRLDEAGLLSSCELVAVEDNEKRKIGPFDVEFIPVTHSVPGAFAAFYSCAGGTIFHTGDFKIDHAPVDGRTTNLARMEKIAGEKDVLLMLSDSTNAERPGTTGSESSIRHSMDDIFDRYDDKRVIVSTFASHIHRIIQVMESAIEHGRKISFLGRSLQGNITAARELGLLVFNEKDFVDIEEINSVEPEKVCVICTGTQGEPLSALSLIASGQSKFISVDENDVVVLSSHAIPGNETGVNRVINGLMYKGARVLHDGNAPVHVSGHASQEELSMLIKLIKPQYFVPVHGEHRHMFAHCQVARDSGIANENVFLCHDGNSIVFSGDRPHIEEEAASSAYLYVDGNVGGITNALLRDRRELGADGLVVVVVTIDGVEGEIIGDIEVVTRGWVPRAHVADYLHATQMHVREILEASLAAGERDVEALRSLVRRAAGEATSDSTGRRPTILPLVIEG
jgi:ribonuclease J